MLRAWSDDPIAFLALNARHSGAHHAEMTAEKCHCKLAAMSCHKSQFTMCEKSASPQGYIEVAGFMVEPRFWRRFSRYHPLVFDGETFDSL
jgi:hypothetical protein